MSEESQNVPSHRKAFGVGLGAGLLGAIALAARYGWRRTLRGIIPDAISPAVFATRVADTSAGEIVYHTADSQIPGAPLLFLHGVFPGASSFEWSRIYPRFAESWRVLVPDMVGFGESQRPNPASTAEEQVRSLAEFLDGTAPREAVVIIASGLSANIALLFASRHPERTVKVILWMPDVALGKANPSRDWHRLGWFPRMARLVYRHQLSTESFLRAWLLRSGFAAESPSLEESVSVISTTAQQYGAEHAFLAQSSKAYWRSLRTGLRNLTSPVSMLLAIGSDKDSSAAISDLRQLVSRFSIVEVSVQGSLAPLSEPDAVTAAIERELLPLPMETA
ncbi:MAG: alpha/beta hydrolase [Verrucomicrobia bacterium]|jgi:pimeloyl-ACP methyl ester carboxylesterase|nr:alpha/beta hydrolase [Verrucomicrobiota bacterium]